MRTTVAYRHSRQASDDAAAAGKWIDQGLHYADSSAAINPEDPDLLEVRGNLRYWRWLLGLETDATAASQLLKQAQTDLETAVKLQPSQAGAWATLSHLYNQTGSGVDVNLAARRALEEDAYLSNANVILSRLFFSSYDLGQFTGRRALVRGGRAEVRGRPEVRGMPALAHDYEGKGSGRRPGLETRRFGDGPERSGRHGVSEA
jgi:hypothetical protein